MKSNDEGNKPPSLSFYGLFRYATTTELIMMGSACFFSMAAGAGLPAFSLIFGNLTNSLAPSKDGNFNPKIVDQAGKYSSYFIYIGIAIGICNFISMGVFLNISEKLTGRIRKAYFKAIIKQEIGWFDLLNPNELTSKVSLETHTIQLGIGDKIPQFLMSSCTIISGFIIAFARGWQLSLVLCGAIPFLAITGALYAWVLANIKQKTNNAYITSSALAEQSLNAIKTVKSLSSEKFEMKNFSFELKKANKIIIKYGILVGLTIGSLYFVMYANYGLAFWFGSITIEKGWYNDVTKAPYDVGNVVTVFFCIMFGSFFLSQLPPPLKAFASAKQSADNVFYIIDRIPNININDKSKALAQNIQGIIEFQNVDFNYPSRSNVQILKNISFTIEKNKKTAFVGESGSGKSTIVSLLERFYDPISGKILIDGIDIKEYNLNSLRKSIGYVGQEPVLFSGTVKENILFGKENATDEEIINALKKANAYDFVNELQNKLDTFIGLGGSQLSGGQKQRLAIARAILKNPPILLLDEATSALDRMNEMAIQKTLDEISASKTTIVIAHRLSTIQDADRIFVMHNGNIDESGTHEELLSRHGRYEALFKMQLKDNKIEENENASEDRKIPAELFLEKSSKKDLLLLTDRSEEKLLLKNSGLIKNLTSSKENIVRNFEKEDEIINIPKKVLEAKKKQVFKRLFQYIFKHKLIFFFATLGSVVNGGIQPIMAITLGEILQTLAEFWLPDFREKVDFFAGMMVVIAVASFFANIFQAYLFSILGEKISYALKMEAYNKILRKPIKFFDDPKNNPGILSAKISIDTQQINSLASTFFGVVIQGVAGFIVGMIIAFFYSWQLTLVALGLSPLVSIGEYFESKMMGGFQGSDESYKASASIIMESVLNIRTLASFCNETMIEKKYNEQVDIPIKKEARKGILLGMAFGGSYFLQFVYYALVFYIAAVLQEKTGLNLKEFFIALFAIIIAASVTGFSSTFLPDIGECVKSGGKVFNLIDSQEEESYKCSKDRKLFLGDIQGKIEIKNLYFKYPTRDNYVLENLNLTILPGQKVAIVGPSGCGKSTLFQLLLKFYEIEKGDILIDNFNINNMSIKQLRSLFGVVSQEPVLFMGTVAYNIKYNKKNSTFEDIKDAAEQANALQFIINNQFEIDDDNDQNKYEKRIESNTKSGFDRVVGSKGNQLSGGQKQRIAIARAIIKKPKILLLDEATSALDTQNENIVQNSLNQIMKNKTSLIIAHRISTIKDADVILVLGAGHIIERGTYEELIQKQGVFHKLERGFSS